MTLKWVSLARPMASRNPYLRAFAKRISCLPRFVTILRYTQKICNSSDIAVTVLIASRIHQFKAQNVSLHV